MFKHYFTTNHNALQMFNQAILSCTYLTSRAAYASGPSILLLLVEVVDDLGDMSFTMSTSDFLLEVVTFGASSTTPSSLPFISFSWSGDKGESAAIFMREKVNISLLFSIWIGEKQLVVAFTSDRA